MKLAPLLCSAVLLAACAPTTLQGTLGRVVNIKTGQEGQIKFVGAFQDRPVLPTDPDNVTITFGSTVYSGRYTVLGGTTPRLGVSLGFGAGISSGAGDPFFGGPYINDGGFGGTSLGLGYDGRHRNDASATRPGNLIVKTAAGAGAAATISCTFQADNYLHGIGNCQDSAGSAYSLQF